MSHGWFFTLFKVQEVVPLRQPFCTNSSIMHLLFCCSFCFWGLSDGNGQHKGPNKTVLVLHTFQYQSHGMAYCFTESVVFSYHIWSLFTGEPITRIPSLNVNVSNFLFVLWEQGPQIVQKQTAFPPCRYCWIPVHITTHPKPNLLPCCYAVGVHWTKTQRECSVRVRNYDATLPSKCAMKTTHSLVAFPFSVAETYANFSSTQTTSTPKNNQWMQWAEISNWLVKKSGILKILVVR